MLEFYLLLTGSCFYRINKTSVNCVLILIQIFLSKYGVFCVLNIQVADLLSCFFYHLLFFRIVFFFMHFAKLLK